MSIPTSVLKRAREDADLNQSEMARRLSVSPSVISRLEKSEITEGTMARRYLAALGSEEAKQISDFYAREWPLTDRPSFFHPDRDALWAAESALQALEIFGGSDDYDRILDGPVAQIRSSLESAVTFVSRLDHGIAWIGPVGVGKTTALSLLTNLVVPGKTGAPQPIFPATGGRTTISEVVVRVAPAYGIAVEAMDDDDVRALVADLVRGMIIKEGGISSELERAVRNMADMRRSRESDPLRELLDRRQVIDDVVEEVVDRMRLQERRETQLILSETSADGLKWLSENATKINFGLHPDFSLPERVTVFVPASALRRTRYDLAVVDTKGVHVTTQRPDLRGHLDNSRTLAVLCTTFNDAPSADALKIMTELKEFGSDAMDKNRVLLLVLPRGDEAMKVADGSGMPVESVEDGYYERELQVQASLSQAGLPATPVMFFNAMTDPPAATWEQLTTHLDVLRRRQLERLQRFVEVSRELIANPNVSKIEEGRRAVEAEVARMVDAYAYDKLGPVVRPAHQNLVSEMRSGHASSINATINRKGGWTNFPVPHMIGVGVRFDANIRTSTVAQKMDGRLESLAQTFRGIPEVVAIVDAMREDLSDWRQEFLAKAVEIGRVAFKPHLDNAGALWESLSSYWGRGDWGAGDRYRDTIADELVEWFEQTPELKDARQKVEARLEDAWTELVLQKLSDAVREPELSAAA
ncbi:MAG TPA: helix-turn-helix transcriptional regulator [Allosphingosinicella sp.]|nr:helix-turn-helix transcriptional regulator [Allosphingosinicella sp.]